MNSTLVARNELAKMPFEGAEKIKHAYIQSFGYILPDPGSLMAEVGFTDQFVVEGAKYTTNSNLDAVWVNLF